MVNAIAEDYRHRIDWIEAVLLREADAEGKCVKADIEAIIYKHYRCSRHSVRRYLETLEGARIITQNSVFLIVEAKRPEKK
jgi:hypothetical protein